MGSPTEATLASATAIDLFRNGDLPNEPALEGDELEELE